MKVPTRLKRRQVIQSALILGSGSWFGSLARAESTSPFEITKSEAEWRKILTPLQFQVLRQAGTEPSFNNPYAHTTAVGIYRCAGCDLPLYSSKAKYDSGTGWPSFWQPINATAIGTKPDNTLWSQRTEVHCRRCGGHLGHVFDDGPQPTGLRYCMNSAALKFIPA